MNDASKTALAVLMILLAKKKPKPGTAGFMQATVQTFMGLIVMAMGVQFGLKGLSAYFHLARL